MKHFEVERKFGISAAEYASIPDKLSAHGFKYEGQVYMTDTFVPAAEDGEMIRIRQETANDQSKYLLTHKQWVNVAGQRERAEQEEQVSELIRACLLDVGKRLKGGALSSFSKERNHYTRIEKGRKVTVALDNVEGLGQYSGYYMEIELIVPASEDVEAARQHIKELAATIFGEERAFVTLSYMEMLKLATTS